MGEDLRFQKVMQALGLAREFLDEFVREPLPGLPSEGDLPLPRTLAASALVRLTRLLPGIELLLERGFGYAAQPAIRTLFEIAINMCWVGTSESRAGEFRDDGLRSLAVWMRGMQAVAPDYTDWAALAASNPGALGAGPTMQRLRALDQRAGKASLVAQRYRIDGLKRAYEFAYRRLSPAAHGEYGSLTERLGSEQSLLFLDARDAVTATMFVIMACGETLGYTPQVEGIVHELRDRLVDLDLDA